jgi:AraC family transcriptional regulator, ethanolamine operon transcriptional activator
LRRLMEEACAPSPLPDAVLAECALAAMSMALTAAGPAPRTSLAARNAWRYVRRVRSYIEDHPSEAPGLETLCRIAGIGARTLETAFLGVTGLSPLQFAKVRRLNAARHVLASADPEDVSVKSAALSHGFWHLGHFAHDYKMLFGESPSATLASHHVWSLVTRWDRIPISTPQVPAFARTRSIRRIILS